MELADLSHLKRLCLAGQTKDEDLSLLQIFVILLSLPSFWSNGRNGKKKKRKSLVNKSAMSVRISNMFKNVHVVLLKF